MFHISFFWYTSQKAHKISMVILYLLIIYWFHCLKFSLFCTIPVERHWLNVLMWYKFNYMNWNQIAVARVTVWESAAIPSFSLCVSVRLITHCAHFITSTLPLLRLLATLRVKLTHIALVLSQCLWYALVCNAAPQLDTRATSLIPSGIKSSS